jgi:hypothetical protein
MFDKSLVHAIVGGKDLDRGSAELSVNLGLTRGHGSLLLELSYSGPSAFVGSENLGEDLAHGVGS